MKQSFRFAALAALPLALALHAPAQPPAAPVQNQGISSQQADEILKELRAIRQLLEKQQARGQEPDQPARAKLNLQGFQMLGNKDAPLTMVEFTDYQCPFCQRFHVATFGDLKKNYIDTGKLRFFSRDMPLDMHRDAPRAAQAGRCAADQGQFWKLRDLMAANPQKLDLESILGYGSELKLDMPAFRSCLETEKYKKAVENDVQEALKLGATGTPTFVVGKSTADGVEGELVVGALPYEAFDAKLKDLAKQ